MSSGEGRGYRMPQMREVEPGDMLADGSVVVEAWSLGAYSASAPRLAHVRTDRGEVITRKPWQRIKVVAP